MNLLSLVEDTFRQCAVITGNCRETFLSLNTYKTSQTLYSGNTQTLSVFPEIRFRRTMANGNTDRITEEANLEWMLRGITEEGYADTSDLVRRGVKL